MKKLVALLLVLSMVACLFVGCGARYANFARALLRGCQFAECQLQDSVFTEARFQKCMLQADFSRADFLHAAVSELDLRRCRIDGALFAPGEVRGMTVTRDQAAGIAAILGLKIQEG